MILIDEDRLQQALDLIRDAVYAGCEETVGRMKGAKPDTPLPPMAGYNQTYEDYMRRNPNQEQWPEFIIDYVARRQFVAAQQPKTIVEPGLANPQCMEPACRWAGQIHSHSALGGVVFDHYTPQRQSPPFAHVPEPPDSIAVILPLPGARYHTIDKHGNEIDITDEILALNQKRQGETPCDIAQSPTSSLPSGVSASDLQPSADSPPDQSPPTT